MPLAYDDFPVVVSIDFGASFSYIPDGKVPKLIADWPNQNMYYSKTPTINLYNGNKKNHRMVEWGWNARHKGIPENIQLQNYKPYLDENLELPPWTGPISIVDAISDYIGALHEVKNTMRQAAIKAKLITAYDDPDRLMLVSEHEAAALYCVKSCREYDIKPGDRFLICDAGGSTVDLIVYDVAEGRMLSEVCKGHGVTCGSMLIDRNFGNLLIGKFGSQGAKIQPELVSDLVEKFAYELKPRFDGVQELFLGLPWNSFFSNLKDPGTIGIDDGRMHFTASELKSVVFDPVVGQVLGQIQRQLDEAKDCSSIFMVGGFGSSAYLLNRVKQEFGAKVKTISAPDRPEIAVVCGAIYAATDHLLETSIHLAENAGETFPASRSAVHSELDSQSIVQEHMNSGSVLPPLKTLKDWFNAVDTDGNGTLSAEELQRTLMNGDWTPFSSLWNYIEKWKACFQTFDLDRSGTIDTEDFHTALKGFGFNLSPTSVNLIAKKYDARGRGNITFDNFVQGCVTVLNLTETFRRMDHSGTGVVTMSYEQFLSVVLKDEDRHVTSSVAQALGKQSSLSESAIQSLIAALKDEDENIRSSAAQALGKQSSLSESAIQSLIAALKDEDENIRFSAAQALGKQSSLSESAIQSLIAALEDEDRNVRYSAAQALGKQSLLSESAIQSLIAALKDEDEDIRFSAAQALGKQSSLSESAIQSLIAALKDEDRNVRSSAAQALGKQSSLSESTIQALIAALKDEDEDVGSSAASALGSQSTLPESAIQSLIAALKDEDRNVRSLVAQVLNEQSSLSESAIQALIAALKDDDEDVRSLAAQALGKQSTLSEPAIQSLIAALKDDNRNVRSSAASALGNQSILPQSAINDLEVVLSHVVLKPLMDDTLVSTNVTDITDVPLPNPMLTNADETLPEPRLAFHSEREIPLLTSDSEKVSSHVLSKPFVDNELVSTTVVDIPDILLPNPMFTNMDETLPAPRLAFHLEREISLQRSDLEEGSSHEVLKPFADSMLMSTNDIDGTDTTIAHSTDDSTTSKRPAPVQVFSLFSTDKEKLGTIDMQSQPDDSTGKDVILWSHILDRCPNAVYLKDRERKVVEFLQDSFQEE
ncbi:hypothetical protein BGZ83_007683 [Gryganskiella cystojenkinii]|nr:hypothetical protein BGZ83_007683 [Gryganskiella cystojenkinii]